MKTRLLRLRRSRLARKREKAPPVTLDQLREGLKRVGVREGHHVYVHSSYIDMPGLQANPARVVQLLLDVVGPTGTILMQARGWTGLSIAYVRGNPSFDPVHTPSADGIITEIFRRWPGTVRSRHPIWSSSGNGAKAKEFLEGHEFADPPFGFNSPWGRLCQAGGYILMLGVELGKALTLVHAAMDMIDEEPFQVYTTEKFPLRIVEADGTQTTIYSKAHSGILDDEPMTNSLVVQMDRAGLIRRERVGHITLHYLPARESVECMIDATKRGKLRRRYLKDV